MKNWRLGLVLGVVFLLAAIIVGRLFFVQVLNRKLYFAQALGQQSGFSEVQGKRGEVFIEKSKDTLGKAGSGDIKSLAINQEKFTVGAVPKNIKSREDF